MDERELRERISDLTRQLDESPAAEQIPEIEAEITRLTDKLNKGGVVSPEQVVKDFCAAWSRLDIDELMTYFTEDAVYHNMPMDPAVGHDAIRAVMSFFVPMSQEITFEMIHIAATGNVVHTERVDRFVMGANNVVLPVAGVFEIRDGKIAAWRDYFDMQMWLAQSSG